jgi:2-oxoglutarate dehydrogenase E2 component (dihydrolipoamide succinyltransferase)
MIVEIKIPSPGESISEVEIAVWLVADGDVVEKNQEIAEIESEKATLSLVADEAGKISIKQPEHVPIAVGDVACTIDTSVQPEQSESSEESKSDNDEKTDPKPAETESKDEADKPEAKSESTSEDNVKITPVAKKLMQAENLNLDDILSGLRKITKQDVESVMNSSEVSVEHEPRHADRERMSSLRRKVSERLVAVKNETAMLTTFNEVDMSEVMRIRSENKAAFIEKYGVKPGFMSFFTRAAAIALREYPQVNAYIDGDDIVKHNYADIGIAVQTPKGLMVPVVRDADKLGIPQLELAIQSLAEKARNKKISVDELSGGTFSITNGGVFGSMLSTPIINPPQSAILGMHNILDRPVAVKGQVEIRPMMYLALSYDHRIIDGKESVGFLMKIKELIEHPEHMLFYGKSAEQHLLGL